MGFPRPDAPASRIVCTVSDGITGSWGRWAFRGSPLEVKEQLLAKGNYDKGEYAVVIELDEDYIFNKVEHTVSAEAMLVDAMVSGKLSPKEAVAAVLSDENNSYSKNELKAAALNLKRMFGG